MYKKKSCKKLFLAENVYLLQNWAIPTCLRACRRDQLGVLDNKQYKIKNIKAENNLLYTAKAYT